MSLFLKRANQKKKHKQPKRNNIVFQSSDWKALHQNSNKNWQKNTLHL